MGGAQREYLEERLHALRALAASTPGEALATSEHERCIARLGELIDLGEDLVALLGSARGDAGLDRLRGWLVADLERQRALLRSLRRPSRAH